VVHDSKNCEIIVQSGSSKKELQSPALLIFHFCVANQKVLTVSLIPRKDNAVADFYSRILDVDDLGVSYAFFTFLNSMCGPFTINIFANYKNRKTMHFNSKFWNPDSEAVDTFTTDWSGENNWLVPPLN
jgi:hypothetical protein